MIKEGHTWRKNEKLKALIEGRDIRRFIKAHRISWVRQEVERLEVARMVKSD